jgi:hypothetical protein
MTRTAEVYCFHDRRYAHDISVLIEGIRAAGHRVLTGEDSQELSMLLQVGLPTAIVYTLADEKSIEGPAFKAAAKQAMDQWLPLILVGPGPVGDSLSLHLLESSGVMERRISLDEVSEIISELADLAHHEKPSVLSEYDGDESDFVSLDDSLVDTTGEPGQEIRVETRIVIEDKARVVTTVTKEGEPILEEAHDIPGDEIDLFGRMEAQHLLALASYTPKAPDLAESQAHGTFQGEVSAPFVIDEKVWREQAESALDLRVREFTLGLSIAMIVAVSTTLGATLLWDIPTPTAAFSDQAAERPQAAEPEVLPPKASHASNRLAQLRSAYMWPPEPHMTGKAPAGEIPFPAKFDIGSSRFGPMDPDEALRFMSMITNLSTAHNIWIVGHATYEEVRQGNSLLAKQRAVEVLRHFAAHGIPKKRLYAIRGEPVTDSDSRRQMVGIIVEN